MQNQPFFTLPDGTSLSYSPLQNNSIRVTARRAAADGSAKQAVCVLPELRWETNDGFSEEELAGIRAAIREKYSEIVASAGTDSGKKEEKTDPEKPGKKKSMLLPVLITLAAVIVIGVIAAVVLHNGSAAPKNTLPDGITFSPPEDEHIQEDQPDITYVDNEILLSLAAGNSREQAEQIAQKYNAEIVGSIDAIGEYQLRMPTVRTEEELLALAQEINGLEGVAYACPHYLINMSVEGVDYDINTGSVWKNDLADSTDIEGNSWHMEAINAPAAWAWMDEHRGSLTPVSVGLIDNGFDVTHEDLGYARVFNNNDLTDKSNYQHGTSVSGVMAANGNNDVGIVGVYPYADGRLYAVSFYAVDEWGREEQRELYNKTSSFSYCISLSLLLDDGVKVINISMGNTVAAARMDYFLENNDTENYNAYAQMEYITGCHMGAFLQKYLDQGQDFVIVNSAGNESGKTREITVIENGVKKTFSHTIKGKADALFNSPFAQVREADYPDVYGRIVIVGAVTQENEPTSFSDMGDRVDIYAPGQNIFSTDNGDTGYRGGINGTSFSSPMIAGAAADVWTVNPALTGAQVKTILVDATAVENGLPKAFDLLKAVEFANDMLADDSGVHIMRADNVGPADRSEYAAFIDEYKLQLTNGQYVVEADPLPIFGGAEYRNSIASIQFDSNFSGMPPVAVAEVSADPDKAIYVWTTECTDTSIRDYQNLREMHICTNGTIRPESCAFLFFGYSNLVSVDFNGVFDTSGVTDFSGMFAQCHNLQRVDLSQLDLSAAQTVDYMLAYCRLLPEADLSRPNNLQNVTDFTDMLAGTAKLSNVTFPDTPFGSKAKSYSSMFWESGINEFRPGGMDTSSATSMNRMFGSCLSLRAADLHTFSTANVTTMSYMFFSCHNLESLDLSSFDTAKVEDMSGMFWECEKLRALDLHTFNTENVTDMDYMFCDCSSAESFDVSGFDTAKVKTMESMFGNCGACSRFEITSFTAESLENVSDMFYMNADNAHDFEIVKTNLFDPAAITNHRNWTNDDMWK